MKSPFTRVRAVMARRILVNFRVRPEALQRSLPAPFRPKLIDGWGLGGICLIRLEQMRPWFMPASVGISSENAAHRFAVEWTEAGTIREGVFIPRRDTNSRINLLAGGRLFPGVHHLARFCCAEADHEFRVELQSRDGKVSVAIEAHLAAEWPGGSLFLSLEEASAFLKSGSCGWSSCGGGHGLEGVELQTNHWSMRPLAVSRVESSFFADKTQFPPGTVEFDSALLMRGIEHTWRALGNQQPGSPLLAGSRRRARAFLELP